MRGNFLAEAERGNIWGKDAVRRWFLNGRRNR